jgi:hypothetical protein
MGVEVVAWIVSTNDRLLWLIGVIGPRENATGVAPAHGNEKAGNVHKRPGS